MNQATDRSVAVGERRRRREAERAAALAAERAGAPQPLTRRELRRREAEEAARREAIATGDLRLGPSGEVETPTEHESAAQPDAAEQPPATTRPHGAATEPEAAESVRPAEAPVAGNAGRLPSRRSIRERRAAADPTAKQSPAVTDGHPVVRTPATAQGVRRLDATGQLTGIQAAVRPDQPPEHPLTGGIPAADSTQPSGDRPVPDRQFGRRTTESTGTVDPTAWAAPVARTGDEFAASSPTAPSPDPAGERPPFVGMTSHRQAETPETDTPNGDPAGTEASGDGSPDQHADSPADASPVSTASDEAEGIGPQWLAVSSVSSSSADDAAGSAPTRRSVRESASAASADEAHRADEGHRRDLAVTVVRVVVLVLVGAVIGALIWLLASEANDDDAPAAAPTGSIAILIQPEENSAS